MTKLERDLKTQVNLSAVHIDSFLMLSGNGKEDLSGENDEEEGLFLFIFKNNKLVYWNNNILILPEQFGGKQVERFFTSRLRNGWYGFYEKEVGVYSIVAAGLIKHEFPFQNDFICDHFSERFPFPPTISLTEKQGSYTIRSSNRDYLFSLEFVTYQSSRGTPFWCFFLLFVFGFLFLCYFIYRYYLSAPWFKSRGNLFFITYAITIVGIRLVMSYAGFPEEVYISGLFGPAGYSSSSFLPSLGDFTINSLVLVVLAMVFHLKGSFGRLGGGLSTFRGVTMDVLSIVVLFVSFHAVGYLITDLVINSSMALNLQNISGLTAQSGLGLFIISALLFSLGLFSSRVLDDFFYNTQNHKWIAIGIVSMVCLFGIVISLAGVNISITVSLFFFVFVILTRYLKFGETTIFSIQHLLFLLCFNAVFATVLLNSSNQVKDGEKVKLLARKIVTQRNPLTEVLYEQLGQRIGADSLVNQWLRQDPVKLSIAPDSLVNYLKTQYFKDYWNKYQVQITLCDPAKELRIQPQGYLVNCNTYFRGVISNFGKATALPNLFFLDYGAGKEYYIAIISGRKTDTVSAAYPTIFIEFNEKNSFPDPGYPGLLMDKTRVELLNLADYSYGLYHNGILIRASGALDYKTSLERYRINSASGQSFTEEGIIHFRFRVSDSDTLLISKNEEDFLSFIAPFSYLFILFSVIVLIIIAVKYVPGMVKPVQVSLRYRLQFALTGTLVITLLAIGIIQIINIIQINKKKNIDNLRERANSVVVEIQHKYGSSAEFRELSESEMEDFLVKLSNIFFTDINVFNDRGFLISSSRWQIYEEGLLSDRMNARAFRALAKEKNSIYIHHEAIGGMQFNSAYLPFYNDQNQLLGYVNLPYFARQDELKKEISAFLVTYLNVYILLILLGVLVTVLISNYITSPLALLAGKMSQLRLGKVNERIGWKRKDEIGQLVSEYNRMIEALGKSAELLARSEREGAWREMARQVAHEIKNPLTPMKLSTQYLEKAWNEKAPDWDQRLARFSKSMVEQIDNLSVIASDFSDFAKMPAVVFIQVDLKEVIEFILSLYRDTTRIRFEFLADAGDAFVFGDRSQLIRVFTNLLNNAVQAIGESDHGMIRIQTYAEPGKSIITVSDNGCGIPPGRTDRIFQPDFTTKTSGMGLGLAIVKGIVEGMNGEISFISEELKGTTFIIKFPSND
ncbi:MAG: ATP-binding protein [Bacteroidales bacterium]